MTSINYASLLGNRKHSYELGEEVLIFGLSGNGQPDVGKIVHTFDLPDNMLKEYVVEVETTLDPLYEVRNVFTMWPVKPDHIRKTPTLYDSNFIAKFINAVKNIARHHEYRAKCESSRSAKNREKHLAAVAAEIAYNLEFKRLEGEF